MNKTELIINKKNSTENLNENDQIGKLTLWKTLKLLKHRSCMRPYILVTYICFLSHFNGMSAVQTYAVNIFNVLQVPIDGHFATALIGIVEMLGCIICVSMVRYAGKRLLAFISLNGTAICFVVLGIYTHSFHIDSLIKTVKNDTLINYTTSLETNVSNPVVYSWIPLVFIIAAAFLSHMGIRVLPWILIGEVFSNETRAIASGMSGANFYIFGFLCNKIFLSMVSQLTLPITFWCFGGFSITGFIVLYFVLPETEGKSLIEISNHFSGKTKLGNEMFLKRKHDISIDEASETLYHRCNTE
ncbi:hypothetical protein WA026_008098 [Henosepilachna vigintioctopunctata]|uniref:Major facilitator superfamily (MFS) profile domain-containing protein n=1 Tax=Henosepilachna vigintioctopunctata TaxID=420089 RepID=A0AAW1TQ91_9CUCU